MSEASVDLVREAYEAWNADGLDALAPVLAETAELEDAPQMPDAARWRGRDAVLRRLAEVTAAVGGGSVEFESFRPVGSEVLVAMRWSVVRDSGVADLGSIVHLVQVSDGRVARVRVFLDAREALEAGSSG